MSLKSGKIKTTTEKTVYYDELPIIQQEQRNDPQNEIDQYPATVHIAPYTQPTMVITMASTCGPLTPSNDLQASLAKAGKVAANCCVGFGEPLTVTVGTLAAGDGGFEDGEAFSARTENRLEVAYMIPDVELRKMRK